MSLDLSLWDDVEQRQAHCRWIKVDLRNHFLGSNSAAHERTSGAGARRREVLQLRMQRRVQRIPELSLLLQTGTH